MKKFLITGICILMTVTLLSGCSDKQAQSSAHNETEKETQNQLPKEPDLEDLKIELGNYKNIKVTIDAIPDVTDEDVEYQIEALVHNGTTQTEVKDRPVAEGDLVKVDYEATVGGVPVLSEKEKDYNILIGSGVFFNGAEKELIGVKPGTVKEIKVTYPSDYPNEELVGKEGIYSVTVNAILEERQAKLTDEFVKEVSVGECTSVKDFRSYIKNNLQQGVDAQNELMASQAAWDQLMKDTVVEGYPEDLLEAKVKAFMQTDEDSAKVENMTLKEYVETYLGAKLEDYRKQIRDEIEKSAKKSVISRAIAREEGLEIDTLTDSDYNEAAEWFGYTDMKMFKETYSDEMIKAELTLKRVTELIMSQAEVTEKMGD